MKSWKKWLGTAVGVLLAGYFVFFVFDTLKAHELEKLLQPRFLAAICGAALLNVVLIPLAGLAWSILLGSMGSYWPPTRLAAIIGCTQLAKYVPGNIAQHIGRTTVALVHGMTASVFMSSVLAETVLLLLASLFTGALCLALSPAPVPVLQVSSVQLLAGLALAVVVAAIALPVLIRNVPRFIHRFRRSETTEPAALPVPSPGAAARAFALYCLSYGVLGVSLWIIASQQEGLRHADLFTLTASFTLAWLTGFLAPGAPAGLGVREGALALLLSAIGPREQVLTIIIAARLATMLGDALSFAIAAGYMKYGKRGAPA